MRSNLILLFPLLTGFFLTPYFCRAQKNIETQQLLWMRYALKLKLSDTYQIRQDLEERVYWLPVRQHQFLGRTLIDRNLGKGWNVATGLTYLRQSLPQDPDVPEESAQSELRPQLEIAYLQPLAQQLDLHHRFWSDFRFFEQEGGGFEYGNNRTRYKVELRYSPMPKITLYAYDEIFINIGKKVVNNVFDQNRYGFSVQYMPHKNFGMELGYINWFQQRPSGVDFYQRHIIRYTIHHSLSLKKKRPQ